MIAIQNAGPGASFYAADKKMDQALGTAVAQSNQYFTQWFPLAD